MIHTLMETLLIVIVVIFLFLGSFRSVLDPGRGHSDLADRRGVPDAALRVHAQPAHAAGHRALGRVWWSTTPSSSWKTSSATCTRARRRLQAAHPRRARTRRADHRHDDHARGGVRAHRHPGRIDRRAVPRIRVHARRRGGGLGHRRADALADDGLAAAASRATTNAASRAGSTAASTTLKNGYTRLLAGHAAIPAGDADGGARS